MYKKIYIVTCLNLALVSLSALSKNANDLRVNDVGFKQGAIVISFSDGRVQTIKSGVEPEYLDYKYTLLDVNFDGVADLIVTDQNGKFSLSEVYIFNDKIDKFNNDIYLQIKNLRVNSNGNFICGINNLSREESQVLFRYSGGVQDRFEFNYDSGVGHSYVDLETMTIDRAFFESQIKRCVTGIDISFL